MHEGRNVQSVLKDAEKVWTNGQEGLGKELYAKSFVGKTVDAALAGAEVWGCGKDAVMPERTNQAALAIAAGKGMDR